MEGPQTFVAYVHAAATLAMAGLIWFVQVVHYPLFARVGKPGFAAYAGEHARRTSRIVVPLMLVEAAAATALVFLSPDRGLALAGLALLALVWISTFALQVPQHRVLARGFDDVAHRRLVATNLLRTLGWTARGGVALALLARAVAVQ